MNSLNDFEIKALKNAIDNKSVVNVMPLSTDRKAFASFVFYQINEHTFIVRVDFIPQEEHVDQISSYAKKIDKIILQYTKAFDKHIFKDPLTMEPEDFFSCKTVISNICNEHNRCCVDLFLDTHTHIDIPHISENIVQSLYLKNKMSFFDIAISCSISIESAPLESDFEHFEDRFHDLVFKDIFRR